MLLLKLHSALNLLFDIVNYTKIIIAVIFAVVEYIVWYVIRFSLCVWARFFATFFFIFSNEKKCAHIHTIPLIMYNLLLKCIRWQFSFRICPIIPIESVISLLFFCSSFCSAKHQCFENFINRNICVDRAFVLLAFQNMISNFVSLFFSLLLFFVQSHYCIVEFCCFFLFQVWKIIRSNHDVCLQIHTMMRIWRGKKQHIALLFTTCCCCFIYLLIFRLFQTHVLSLLFAVAQHRVSPILLVYSIAHFTLATLAQPCMPGNFHYSFNFP